MTISKEQLPQFRKRIEDLREENRKLPPPGTVFGWLKTTAETGKIHGGQTAILCECECGVRKLVRLGHLKTGKVKSCGCRHYLAYLVHGQSKTPEHKIWQGILERTTNPKHRSWPYYGARGITVCERWLDFRNFFADMGLRPSPAHSIDRIDNDKGYSQENCRWTTWKEQQNNRRNCRMIIIDGVTLSVSDWCERRELNRQRVFSRLRRGMSPEKALDPGLKRTGRKPKPTLDGKLPKRAP